MNHKIRNSILLLFASVIWGAAFVAQTTGGDAVGPYSFNCIRSLVGSLVLLPVIALSNRLHLTDKKPKTPKERKVLLLGGMICGGTLFAASTLQQVGITMGTAAGKAGFLTACYIVLVPVFGLFFGKKCGWNILIGILSALIGLYLLCMTGGEMSIKLPDLLLLLCAVMFSFQILAIDHFAPLVDSVRLSCLEFAVCGLIGIVPAVFLEMLPGEGAAAWFAALMTPGAWISILYAGILSCGVAYTLQIIGQNGLNPAVASLLMSLESVFSVLFGALILGQQMQPREAAGCVMVFAAVLLAQIPVKDGK